MRSQLIHATVACQTQVLVPALLEGGWRDLETRCSMTPGVPLKPMLAKICNGLQDALDMLSGHAFAAEYKYDGMRAQIHLIPDGSVRVFSRNCEDRTASFPDVVAAIKAAAQGACMRVFHDDVLTCSMVCVLVC